MNSSSRINDYLRTTDFPTIWCPGCGHGIILKAAIRAIASLGLDKDDIIAVSGIGCSARTPAYGDFNCVQTTHGRAIAFATGLKLQRPDKRVILFLGDGDCMAIGGNHFIHAARRNIDLTVIVMNNMIYGMTGGQVSPATPFGDISSTTPFGNLEPPTDVCGLAKAAGASYVARGTVYHVNQLHTAISKAIAHKGFSVVEALDVCPTAFGRKNNFRGNTSMYEWLNEISVPVKKAAAMTPAELEGKAVIGVLHHEPEKPEYCDKLHAIIEEVRREKNEGFNYLDVQPGAKPAKGIKEYRLSGSGGQGLILAGILFGEAAIIMGNNAVHSQSYGTEARGGASRSEVIVSDAEIDFPEVHRPDVLLTMNQASCDKFVPTVKEGGVILVDSTLVERIPQVNATILKMPITGIAVEECKLQVVANVVAVGALTRITGIAPIEVMEKVVAARVPERTRDVNLKALRKGYEYAATL